MGDILTSCDLHTNSDNLEDIYMELYDRDAESSVIHDARVELECRIEQYFNSFQINQKFFIIAISSRNYIKY